MSSPLSPKKDFSASMATIDFSIKEKERDVTSYGQGKKNVYLVKYIIIQIGYFLFRYFC